MRSQFLIAGHFRNAEGNKIEFVDMRMPGERDRKNKQMMDVQRKLRDEKCTQIILRLRSTADFIKTND